MTVLTLSKFQLDIISYLKNEKGNLLINAVAGSGKTTMLMMLMENIPLDAKALLCAFNVKIAETLQEKLNAKGISNGIALNIHKLGFKIIQQSFPNIRKWNIKGDKGNKILEDIFTCYPCNNLKENQKVEYYNTVKEFCRLGYLKLFNQDTDTQSVNDLIEAYNLHIIVNIDIVYAWQTFLDYLERTIASARKGNLCFNDMICLPHYLGLTSTVKYNYILIDECQDLNNAQIDVVLAYSSKKTRLFFVGDKKQAIYGFTGSNANNFELIAETVGNCSELPLSVCYRCDKSIISYAQKFNPDILPYEENKEGEVKDISLDELIALFKEEGYSGKDKVFLARKNSQLIKMFFYLLKLKVPAFVNGRDLGKGLQDYLKDLEKSITFSSLIDYLDSQEKLLREQNKFNPNLEDKFECLRVILEETTSYSSCYEFIEKLTKINFNNKALELSSIHKSKGQEYEKVYLLTQSLPLVFSNQQEWQYEQEINLAYVAATRAKNVLYLLDEV